MTHKSDSRTQNVCLPGAQNIPLKVRGWCREIPAQLIGPTATVHLGSNQEPRLRLRACELRRTHLIRSNRWGHWSSGEEEILSLLGTANVKEVAFSSPVYGRVNMVIPAERRSGRTCLSWLGIELRQKPKRNCWLHLLLLPAARMVVRGLLLLMPNLTSQGYTLVRRFFFYCYELDFASYTYAQRCERCAKRDVFSLIVIVFARPCHFWQART